MLAIIPLPVALGILTTNTLGLGQLNNNCSNTTVTVMQDIKNSFTVCHSI